MAYKTRDELLKEIEDKNKEIKDLKKDIEKSFGLKKLQL